MESLSLEESSSPGEKDPLRDLPSPRPCPLPLAEASQSLDMDHTEQARAALHNYTASGADDQTKQILGAFLEHLARRGRRTLAQDICTARSDGTLKALGDFLSDAILKPVMVAGASNPMAYISPPPGLNANKEIEAITRNIEGSFRSDQTVLREHCLKRDGFQCVLTGVYNSNSVQKGLVTPPQGSPCGSITASHIIPFGLRKFNRRSSREVEHKATIWWALHRYFPFLRGNIDAKSVNKVANTLSLRADLSQEYDKFRFSIAPDPQAIEPRYHLESDCGMSCDMSVRIILLSTDPHLDAPDPDFLLVRDILYRIFKVSGMGMRIMDALEAYEDANIAADGSTELGDVICGRMLIDI